MIKYIICVIKGNEQNVISLHDTKEEAIEAGEKIAQDYLSKKGTICCLSETYENNSLIENAKRYLYKAWI